MAKQKKPSKDDDDEILPDYKRPFAAEDFRGYFVWSEEVTELVGRKLYHACHLEEIKEYLAEGFLGLRSDWSLVHPLHGKWTTAGVWVGLNHFSRGNYYGPFLMEWPLSALEGKQFMVFRRMGEDRRRYFFVQYEARIPIYNFISKDKENLWREVGVESYFGKGADKAIWDIVLTQPIPLDGMKVTPFDHPKCISRKCSGMSRDAARKHLKELVKVEFKKWLLESPKYARFLKQFPTAPGLTITLPDPDDDDDE